MFCSFLYEVLTGFYYDFCEVPGANFFSKLGKFVLGHARCEANMR